MAASEPRLPASGPPQSALTIRLREAVAALHVSPATMEQAGAAASAAGDIELAGRLRGEWVNDLLPRALADSDGEWAAATLNPDHHFLTWLAHRLAKPFHVTYRARQSALARFGAEVLLTMCEVRWAQEVAWAARASRASDDEACILAGLWLKATRRDCGGAFLAMAELYQGLPEVAYRTAAEHGWTEDEIADCPDEALASYTPLWRRLAAARFDAVLTKLRGFERARLAHAIRSAAIDDAKSGTRTRLAAGLRRQRPALMLGVLERAVAMGLDADALLATELAFIEAVRTGALTYAPPALRAFLAYLDAAPARALPVADIETARRRSLALATAGYGWTRNLTLDIKRLGAQSRGMLDAWKAETATAPPADLELSYGLWLARRVRRQALPAA